LRRYFDDSEAEMANNKLVALVVLIAVLFTLHIADHTVRGDFHSRPHGKRSPAWA
jgi:hypothetical protein